MDLKHIILKKHSVLGKAARATALLLCAAMVLPAAACKKKSGGNTAGQEQQNPSGGSDSTRSRSEYVLETDPYYSDTKVKLEIPTDPKREVSSIEADRCAFTKSGDALLLPYTIVYLYTEEEQKLMENADREDPDQLAKYFEIQSSNCENGILIYSLDGKNTGKITMPLHETLGSFTPLQDGRIAVYTSIFDEANGDYGRNLIFYDKSGKEESKVSCSDEDYPTIWELTNGNIVALSTSSLSLLDKNGNNIGAASYENISIGVYQIDGKNYLATYSVDYLSETIREHFFLQEIDPNTGALSDPTELPAAIPLNLYASDGKYYGVENNIKRYDILQGTNETVCYTQDTNVEFSRTENVLVTPDGDIYTVDMMTDSLEPEPEAEIYLTRLHKEAKNPYAGRRIVYVGTCLDTSYDVQSLICAYNRRPESKARVLVCEGGEDLTYSVLTEKADAADKLLLDMKSGTGPDVLMDCAELSQFNSDGILVDLNTYMDGKDPIDRTKFFDNVFRAFEVGGKLYQLPVFFSIHGFNGNPDLIGDPGKWTISDFDQKMGALGDSDYAAIGTFDYSDDASARIGLLHGLLYADMSHYVDYSKNEAYFDSDDFRKILEICKKYGDKIPDEKMAALREEFDEIDNHRIESLIMQAGVSALSTNNFVNLSQFADFDDLCKGSSCFLGWPTSTGSGMTAKATLSAGISAFSKCPEEAWDFISFLLSPEMQEEFSNYDNRCISVSRNAEKLEMERCREAYNKAQEEYWGNDVDDINNKKHLIDDKTEQDYLHVIESVGASMHTDPAIMLIVEEEAAAYFSGAKDADNVSKSIQNRVKLLLQEKA